MKKIYLLALLCCFSIAASAQTVIYASGAAAAFITGSATSTTRTANNINCTPAPAPLSRGYAVFDLSAIPSSATITSVVIGAYVSNYFSAGPPPPSGWATYGFPGDLSLVTVPATLYADIIAPASTLLSNSSYGTAIGAFTIPSSAASINFVQTNIGNKISIGFTGGNKAYVITGETGALATTGNHAPYISVTYTCAGITGLTATPSPSTLCQGTTLNLTGTATGATTYSWAGPGGFSSTGLTTSLTTGGASSGVYTFTATNSTGCSVRALTSAVVVNPLPATTITPAGATAFCAGGSVVLDAPAIAGYTYIWFDGPTPIPSATNSSYTASTTGSFSVQVGDANGCVSTSSAEGVVLLSTATINPSGSHPLCAGSNVTLTAGAGGTSSSLTYQWQVAGSDITGATNSTFTTVTSGAYNCVISASPTCTVTTTVTTLTIFPLPNPPVVQVGGSIMTSSSYVSYQWFLNTVALPGATSYSVPATANGSYRVRVTDGNGCTNYSSSYWFGSLGVNHLTAADVKIYPNPANDVLHIEAPATIRAVITGIEGRSVMEVNDAKDINISGLANGLYLVILYDSNGDKVAVQKLAKQ